MPKLAATGLDVFPLCLGGNVFGWTTGAYAAAGGNVVLYSGGESERITGRRGRRDDMVIATRAGMARGMTGLRPETIRAAAEASPRRLGVDPIDRYYAHRADAELARLPDVSPG